MIYAPSFEKNPKFVHMSFEVLLLVFFELHHAVLLETYIDQRQMRWDGHVSRMPWNLRPRKMLTAWCNSKIPKGAPQMKYGRNLNFFQKKERRS